MATLADIKRPPLALVKLVEAIGILLRIPKASSKSQYKAPIPSNYDATVKLLSSDFYGTMNKLTLLQSNGIPNDVAIDLYSKTQEQYFNYEDALLAGGLAVRELFNVLVLILNHLQTDYFRIPVKSTNIFVVVDGTRSSYLAFDAATHLLNHGVCHVAALSSNDPYNDQCLPSGHLTNDLIRRCREQYKIADTAFRVDPLQPNDVSELISLVEQSLQRIECPVLVVGIDSQSSCGSTEYMSEFIRWAAWSCERTAVLAKSFSRVRPFPQSFMSRKFQVCVKEVSDLQPVFSGALQIMRPGDSVVLVCVVHSGQPIGDSRDMRFDMGRRGEWVEGEDEREREKDNEKDNEREREEDSEKEKESRRNKRPGWNEKQVREIEREMETMLIRSQSDGCVRIEKQRERKTIGQELVRVSQHESVDFIVMRRGREREREIASDVSEECLQRARCTVVFTV